MVNGDRKALTLWPLTVFVTVVFLAAGCVQTVRVDFFINMSVRGLSKEAFVITNKCVSHHVCDWEAVTISRLFKEKAPIVMILACVEV